MKHIVFPLCVFEHYLFTHDFLVSYLVVFGEAAVELDTCHGGGKGDRRSSLRCGGEILCSTATNGSLHESFWTGQRGHAGINGSQKKTANLWSQRGGRGGWKRLERQIIAPQEPENPGSSAPGPPGRVIECCVAQISPKQHPIIPRTSDSRFKHTS
ncbi:hypothetical protein Q5P01_011797 [Channa striata]|uniref:Uncharacterized protein n=1 Tax=Channa striata TaxID=64152 RepID=A0AA88MWZ1_CHASR|nr:hypothetical protein Q5P01_011797 [Channa striata]